MNRTDVTPFWKALDWWVVGLYVLLCVVGCLSIYGASFDFEHPGFFDMDQRSGKQVVWFLLALVIGAFLLMMDSNTYYNWSFILYAGIILILLLTLAVATDVKGSRSWLNLGFISIQPAELAKFSTALALSRLMSSYNFQLRQTKSVLMIGSLILLPMLIIVLQKETGSALVFAAFILMLFREGMPGVLLFLLVCLVAYFVLGIRFGEDLLFQTTSLGPMLVLLLIFIILCGMLITYRKDYALVKGLIFIQLPIFVVALLVNALGWFAFDVNDVLVTMLILTVLFLLFKALVLRMMPYFYLSLFVLFSIAFLYSTDYAFDKILEPHHRVRIQVLLGMKDDPSGAGYNVNQSKIAIGSGGLFGKGFLNGTQTKLKYVPEQDTDFIFCTVGEEQGLMGSAFVLGLYLALFLRLIYLAERQRNPFARIYGYCVVSILFFHVFVNIGMVLGLMPVIGIPSPFLSYGGSSLWSFTILLFIFLRLDADRTQYR